ncbi:MAG TPA: GspE/PulE family protein [Acidimicrobiia bacterium]|nr:GspE/PulE family protein [Acidimicrobiia bacterium]
MRLTRTPSDLANDGTLAADGPDEDRSGEPADEHGDVTSGDLLNADLAASAAPPTSAGSAPTATEGDTLLPDQHEESPAGPGDDPTPADASGPPPTMPLPAPPVPAPPAHVTAPAGAPAAAPRAKRRNAKAARHAEKPAAEPDDHAPPHGSSDETADDAELPRRSGRPLGELLVGRGLVSEDQLGEALTKQTTSGKRLGNLLVELGLLSERALTDVLAEQLGLDVVDLSRAVIDPDVVALLDQDDARRLSALPTRRDGTRVEVAVADPLIENLDTQLIELLGSLVRIRLAVRSDLEQALDRCYAPSADLGDALRMFEARLEARKASQSTETVVQTVVDENAPVVKIVNVILEQAVLDRASDVHIEPMGDTVRVRVRTDGALHQITTLPGPMGPSLISRIKVMSDMNIVERRRPQDGQMAVTIGTRDLDVRVSTMPTAFGEKCVMRILDKTRAVIELPALGMAAETYARYYDLIKSPYGMVICAGPTGSGKTTTLYATLTAINSDEINLVTIEDPVEYVFPTINQIQINEPAGLTFANCLRSVLRQDPDAILVGEIRDVETARIATQAALTGHFVVSSLHATDATSALHRFMDMGIEPFLVASSLLGVVGQRLVRHMCEHCVEPYSPTAEERSFFERGGGSPNKVDFVAGVGCNFCGHTGYFDRIGIYEVLAVTDEMKELIVTDAPHAQLRALAIEQGMTTLRDQAIRLVTENKTTIAEVLRTVYVL